MLSTAAWNAFLKTLEEPPPNTVFVLATTEASKVPATVVDRCHRFDFHRPTVEQIASVVRRTAQAESIEIPPRGGRGAGALGDGQLPRRAGHARADRHLQRPADRAGGRAGGARRGGRAPAGSRRWTRSASGDARGALRALEECAEQGRDAALVRGGPGGARARAAGRADARRGAGGAVADARGGRGAAGAGRARGARDGGARCWSCWARRWRRCARAPTRARAWSSRW